MDTVLFNGNYTLSDIVVVENSKPIDVTEEILRILHKLLKKILVVNLGWSSGIPLVAM